MIDQVKAIERAVLGIAVALLPLLILWGAIDADTAAVVGGILSSLSAGLRLPDAAQVVTRRGRPKRRGIAPNSLDEWRRQVGLQAERFGDPARGAELEAQLTTALGRLAQRLGDQVDTPDDGHGDRPGN